MRYVLLLWLIVILISVVPGIYAWDFVHPETFIGGVGFLIVWGLFSYITRIVVSAIGAAIFHVSSSSEIQPSKGLTEQRPLGASETRALPNTAIKATAENQSEIRIARRNPFITRPVPQLPTEWLFDRGKLNDVILSSTTRTELCRHYGQPRNVRRHSRFTNALIYDTIIFISDVSAQETIVGAIINTESNVVLQRTVSTRNPKYSNEDIMQQAIRGFEDDAFIYNEERTVFNQPVELARLMEYFRVTIEASTAEGYLEEDLTIRDDIGYFKFVGDYGDETGYVILSTPETLINSYLLAPSLIMAIEFYTVQNHLIPQC